MIGTTRASVGALAAAVALTTPPGPASAAPGSAFRVQSVQVSVDPSDPYTPVVTYRLGCSLPAGSPLRSGWTQDTAVLVRQTRGDEVAWWHWHGPFEVPRAYTCGETVTLRLTTDAPGGYAAREGVAQVSVREVFTVDGATVTATYEHPVVLRTARS